MQKYFRKNTIAPTRMNQGGRNPKDFIRVLKIIQELFSLTFIKLL